MIRSPLACEHFRGTMKHLKSSLSNLRQVFDQSISVRYLAEPLASFDQQRPCPDVLAFMNSKDFDVVGVRQNGSVVGYVHRTDLREGTLKQYTKSFNTDFRIALTVTGI